MMQVRKFYLASFLKNQTYFVPIIVLFFQDLGLSYAEIFWIFTIGSIFSFVIEIPTGIFADVYGKRRGILISKFLIFVAFIAFAMAFNFWTLLLANLIYELGKSFRSGTETAYTYSYLTHAENVPSYTYVKANQKFYARISESIGTALGGFIAYKLGFQYAFWIAAIPAFINFLQTTTWIKLPECEHAKEIYLKNNIKLAKDSLVEAISKPEVRKVIFNIAFFSTAVLSLDKFVQPYMQDVGVSLKYIGLIYSAFLFAVAFLARYADKIERRYGAVKVINYLTLISFLPVIALGLGVSAIWGIALFFFVLMVENVRSPIANTLFHAQVQSDNRATMGSILELFKSSIKLLIFPIVGHMADIYSMQVAMIVIAVLIILTAILLKLTFSNPRVKLY